MSLESTPQSTGTSTHLVDVLLITYNHEKFVAQAIESILTQQANFEFKLTIGDDCSTDGTRDILRRYVEKYPNRITLLLDDQHRGLTDRERVGIKTLTGATARYIALLDGDDYWTDHYKLQKQVNFLESHADFSICFHNVTMFYEGDCQPPVDFPGPQQPSVSELQDLFTDNFIPTCSVMFRRDDLKQLPDWFFTITPTDWPLHILNARYGKIGYLNEVMAAYRVHGAGAWSAGNAATQAFGVIRMLALLEADLGPRYEREILHAKGEWYYQLSELMYQSGDITRCKEYLKQYLACGGLRSDRRTVSLFLRARQPALYNALRSIRGSVRSVMPRNPGK